MWRRAQAASSGVARRHRPCSAVAEKAGASLPDGLEKTGAALVWKRQGRVIRGAWAVDLKQVAWMRARAGNGSGAGGARIRADGAEQPRASRCLGASAAVNKNRLFAHGPYDISLNLFGGS